MQLRFLLTATLLLSVAGHCSAETILFESGTLGPTSVTWDDVFSQNVPARNLSGAIFNGVRFEVDRPVSVSRIGGHFVGPAGTDDSFFGAIVELEDFSDFPDSEDLSSPDVVGHSLLEFPEPSAEVFGDLDILLTPGTYGLVFGSRVLGASGTGGALLNNTDVDSPSYFGFAQGFGWGPRDTTSGFRFIVVGTVVPEPSTLFTLIIAIPFFAAAKCYRSQQQCTPFYVPIRWKSIDQ